jgi:VWFA-related protein
MFVIPRTIWVLLLAGGVNAAQAQNGLPDAPQPQNLPLPSAPQVPEHRDQPDQPTAEAASQPAQPPPDSHITTLPPGQAPAGEPSAREQLFKLTTSVNFVQVPVTVKDDSGRLMNGLLHQNFSLLENGVKQDITFFTSDPFPISAAVIVDISLPSTVLDRIKQTFSALTGAFSQYDEIALYIYGNTVQKRQDFLAALSDKTLESLRSLRKIEGSPSGPAIADSPMTAGPSVNSRPFPDTGPVIRTTENRAYPESAVLNDAIAAAAADLGRRDPTRRRILFVISDGREKGSNNSYTEVLRVLLTNNVTLFAVGVDTAALPIYDKLSRLRLPRQGTGNILPRYASATGGEVLAEFSRASMEDAYSRLADEARNQYTIGYYSNAPRNSMGYRSIDVRVNRPNLKVYARDGYYPAPPK